MTIHRWISLNKLLQMGEQLRYSDGSIAFEDIKFRTCDLRGALG